MNKYQRIAVAAGLLLALLNVLFPPSEGRLATARPPLEIKTKFLGYHFLFAPPPQANAPKSGGLPITTDNVEKWWSVAKRWMDEQWETNPTLFTPLLKACKHEKSQRGKDGKKIVEKVVPLDCSDTGLFDSEIKSRVIDLRLKEAFFALAKPADL